MTNILATIAVIALVAAALEIAGNQDGVMGGLVWVLAILAAVALVEYLPLVALAGVIAMWWASH